MAGGHLLNPADFFLKTPATDQLHGILYYFQRDVHLKYLFWLPSMYAPRLHSMMSTFMCIYFC